MADFDLKEHPHRRFNPLTREWILVSPHRSKRPWLGQVEKIAEGAPPPYDPGVLHVSGKHPRRRSDQSAIFIRTRLSSGPIPPRQ